MDKNKKHIDEEETIRINKEQDNENKESNENQVEEKPKKYSNNVKITTIQSGTFPDLGTDDLTDLDLDGFEFIVDDKVLEDIENTQLIEDNAFATDEDKTDIIINDDEVVELLDDESIELIHEEGIEITDEQNKSDEEAKPVKKDMNKYKQIIGHDEGITIADLSGNEGISEEKLANYVSEYEKRIGNSFTTELDVEQEELARELLRQEIQEEEDKIKKKRKRIITVFLIIFLILAIFFGYKFIRKQMLVNDMKQFPTINQVSPLYQSTYNKVVTNEDATKADEGKVIGYIEIPALEKKIPLLQGKKDVDPNKVLKDGAVHDALTPLVGEKGNSVIAGHREGEFKVLENLQQQDLIIVTVGQNTYLYEVQDLAFIEDNKEETEKVFAQNTDTDLTLYTCYPFKNFSKVEGRWKVTAKRIEMYSKEIVKRV